ncbi:hypothetical protein AMAG_07540 [Allomyces macrogynus ATCC 38327]|uniref:Ribonucleases P/MRP subunit Pop8-like domain-containing protein n=1 Tax=Allomyces macrogynus (strain ATCC 38327) TaxID=578462 RepID=A0A0L0SIH6_ALLM3|nr:hypothetical protein AMAG_07540 [Allomyces macrogynus ATCC 38327]|eukprot:KNE62308.1 hypothetical protein AMAG_07540 [Allomyces macrogynus ATCC 38327]
MALAVTVNAANQGTYLNIKLSRPLELLELRQLIHAAATDSLGVLGGAINVDILKFRGDMAVLRIPSDHAQQLWAALSMVTSFQDTPIKIVATARDSLLLGLSAAEPIQV